MRLRELRLLIFIFPLFTACYNADLEPDITYKKFVEEVRGEESERSVDCGTGMRRDTMVNACLARRVQCRQ